MINGWKPVTSWIPVNIHQVNAIKEILARPGRDPDVLVEFCHCFKEWSFRVSHRDETVRVSGGRQSGRTTRILQNLVSAMEKNGGGRFAFVGKDQAFLDYAFRILLGLLERRPDWDVTAGRRSIRVDMGECYAIIDLITPNLGGSIVGRSFRTWDLLFWDHHRKGE
jgi:hypothetical protein